MKTIPAILVTFVTATATAAVVMFVWELLLEGRGAIDWGAALALGAAVGVAVPVSWKVAGRGSRPS